MTEAAAGAAAIGADAGAAAAAVAASAGGQQQQAAWHANIDQGLRDFWAQKKYDLSDPVKLAESVTRSYQGAEKLLGVPADEMLRMPKANADSGDINAFWEKVGVPKEAKEYDFSAIKFADGTELDQAFTDTMRAALHNSRTPKERAPEVVKAIVKFMEAGDAAELADVTTKVQAEAATLDKNWGINKAANLVVAQAALERLGQAAGLTAEQTKAGWDALSKVGGVGASYAMEMLRIAGSKMGEDRFVGGGPQGGGTGIMSREAAKTEIDSLKKDADFGRRLLAGGREERRKWDDLHKIAFPPAVA